MHTFCMLEKTAKILSPEPNSIAWEHMDAGFQFVLMKSFHLVEAAFAKDIYLIYLVVVGFLYGEQRKVTPRDDSVH